MSEDSKAWQQRTELLLGKDKTDRLSQAHVLVVGLGGVGAYAAEMICRAGVGWMTIVDADTVQPSNINRQLPATHSSLGRQKAEVLAERFLDINPIARGHVLVIPRKIEKDYIFDIDDATYSGLWAFAKKVAEAVKKAIPCKRVGVAVLGMEVPHAHIHLVPLNSEADLDFRKPKLELSKEEFTRIAESILTEYGKLQ